MYNSTNLYNYMLENFGILCMKVVFNLCAINFYIDIEE